MAAFQIKLTQHDLQVLSGFFNSFSFFLGLAPPATPKAKSLLGTTHFHSSAIRRCQQTCITLCTMLAHAYTDGSGAGPGAHDIPRYTQSSLLTIASMCRDALHSISSALTMMHAVRARTVIPARSGLPTALFDAFIVIMKSSIIPYRNFCSLDVVLMPPAGAG